MRGRGVCRWAGTVFRSSEETREWLVTFFQDPGKKCVNFNFSSIL